MRSFFAIVAFVAIGAASVSNSQEPNQSAAQELREYGEFSVGTWTGEGTLGDDVPGLGEKGEKIVGRAETQWDLGGTVITCRWSFGAATGTWIATWDPLEKRIKRYHFSSTGSQMVATLSKENGKWIASVVGSSEGKELKETDIWVAKDDDDTIAIDETDIQIGGEDRPDIHHEWKRAE